MLTHNSQKVVLIKVNVKTVDDCVFIMVMMTVFTRTTTNCKTDVRVLSEIIGRVTFVITSAIKSCVW